MANLLTLSLALFVALLGGSTASPAGMTVLGRLTETGREFSVSNRILKLVEAELECRKYKAELVTIDNAEECLEVEQWIRSRELAGVWTGGVPNSWNALSYKWSSNNKAIEYFNWKNDSAPKQEDFRDERQWQKSGIALTSETNYKWELLGEQNLYQALCVTPSPCQTQN